MMMMMMLRRWVEMDPIECCQYTPDGGGLYILLGSSKMTVSNRQYFLFSGLLPSPPGTATTSPTTLVYRSYVNEREREGPIL